jgi:hypothetical protein
VLLLVEVEETGKGQSGLEAGVTGKRKAYLFELKVLGDFAI